MNEVIKQAPDGLDTKIIRDIFEKNNEDVIKTLLELWEISEEKTKEISKEQKEWNEIRDTCDAFDTEMYNMLNEAKKNTIKL